ncbi:MAG TPA: hypothetical protein VKE42_07085 [Candidatus Cybelea sp.]|nr:hypothetical protein [Candidatus Cybelea sp.]
MRATLLAACLLLAGVTPSPSPVPSPSPSPTPAPIVTPVAPSSAVPSPAPAATPAILMLPPNAPPQILWIALSSTAPHAGDTLAVTVLTSSNVASVELRVGGYGSGMTKTDVGHFQLASTVPKLPFFMGHNLTLDVIARNTAGLAAQQSVALHVR